MSAVTLQRMTVEEFVQLHGGDQVELIDGIVRELPNEFDGHTTIKSHLANRLLKHVETNKLGGVSALDTLVLTHRDPNRIRAADIAFWSCQNTSSSLVTQGVVEQPPEVAVGITGAKTQFGKSLNKAVEYFQENSRSSLSYSQRNRPSLFFIKIIVRQRCESATN
jgi:hypothetical protein